VGRGKVNLRRLRNKVFQVNRRHGGQGEGKRQGQSGSQGEHAFGVFHKTPSFPVRFSIYRIALEG